MTIHKNFIPDPNSPAQQWVLEEYRDKAIIPIIYWEVARRAETFYGVKPAHVTADVGAKDKLYAVRPYRNDAKSRDYETIVEKCLDSYVKLGAQKGWDVLAYLEDRMQEHVEEILEMLKEKRRRMNMPHPRRAKDFHDADIALSGTPVKITAHLSAEKHHSPR